VYCVYAIRSSVRDRVYIGQTEDLDKRLSYHNAGYVNSTAKDRPWDLIAKQDFETRNEARWMERELKRSRGKREKWLMRNGIENVKLGYAPEGLRPVRVRP
jgi:putative endonuclease